MESHPGKTINLVHVITTTGTRVVTFVSQHGVTEMILQEVSTFFPMLLLQVVHPTFTEKNNTPE